MLRTSARIQPLPMPPASCHARPRPTTNPTSSHQLNCASKPAAEISRPCSARRFCRAALRRALLDDPSVGFAERTARNRARHPRHHAHSRCGGGKIHTRRAWRDRSCHTRRHQFRNRRRCNDRHSRPRADRRRWSCLHGALRTRLERTLAAQTRPTTLFQPHRLARNCSLLRRAGRIPRTPHPPLARSQGAPRALPGERRRRDQHRRHHERTPHLPELGLR